MRRATVRPSVSVPSGPPSVKPPSAKLPSVKPPSAKLVSVELGTVVELGSRPRARVPSAATFGRIDDELYFDGFADEHSQWVDQWAAEVAPIGSAGEVHTLAGVQQPIDGVDVDWLIGVGDGKPADWRAAGAAMVRAANERAQARHEAGARVARTLQLRLPHSIGADEVGALVTGALLGGYRFVVSAQPAPPSIGTLRLIAGEDAVDRLAEVVRTASTLAAATALARDLANTPSNVKTPRWLAGQAIRAVGGLPGMTAIEHDERWLAEHGFGGVLAVGGGSASPPRLIELRWRPRGSAKAPHLVLVGKGITFDTGGISLKPADGMHLMRTDMAGGAAVIAAMRAIGTLRLPLRVTALVPAAENHVSGSAYRPGDVVRHYGGITTEVSNTDAEGRLVLADALAYACARLRPGHIVDVATLTGAMKVSLGMRTGGLFATDDELARRVLAAGERAGERWWRMPLADVQLADTSLADAVRGQLADVRQTPAGPPGITAALFLRAFVGGNSWAHLDIAGPARAESEYAEVTAGATGFAARTLVELAAGLAAKS